MIIGLENLLEYISNNNRVILVMDIYLASRNGYKHLVYNSVIEEKEITKDDYIIIETEDCFKELEDFSFLTKYIDESTYITILDLARALEDALRSLDKGNITIKFIKDSIIKYKSLTRKQVEIPTSKRYDIIDKYLNIYYEDALYKFTCIGEIKADKIILSYINLNINYKAFAKDLVPILEEYLQKIITKEELQSKKLVLSEYGIYNDDTLIFLECYKEYSKNRDYKTAIDIEHYEIDLPF